MNGLDKRWLAASVIALLAVAAASAQAETIAVESIVRTKIGESLPEDLGVTKVFLPASLANYATDPANVAAGEKLVRKFGCPGCHDIPGMESESRIGAELSAFGGKTHEELFFGNRTDLKEDWDTWTFHKIKEPRGYETDWIEQVMPNFELPDEDILALRVFLASRTEKMRLGYGVRLMPRPYNHPVRTAESVAVLDLLSDGRVDFGTGRSATRIELEGFGINPADTRDMWREAIEHVVGCWTNERYSFDGKYWSLPDRRVQPKPSTGRLSCTSAGARTLPSMPSQSRTIATSPKGTPVCAMPNGPGFMPSSTTSLGPLPKRVRYASCGARA